MSSGLYRSASPAWNLELILERSVLLNGVVLIGVDQRSVRLATFSFWLRFFANFVVRFDDFFESFVVLIFFATAARLEFFDDKL